MRKIGSKTPAKLTGMKGGTKPKKNNLDAPDRLKGVRRSMGGGKGGQVSGR